MQIHNHRHIFTALRAALIPAVLLVLLFFFRKLVLEIMGLLFGAAAMAFVLVPLCRLLEARMRRPRAALFSLFALLVFLGSAAALALPALLRQLSSLSDILPEAIGRIRSLSESIAVRLQAQVPGFALPKLNFSGMEGSLMQAVQGAVATMSGFAGKVYRIFLTASLSYFFLADRERILLRLELLVPLSWRCFAVRAGNTLVRELHLYLKGQATIALAVGSLAAIAMLLIGLEGAPLLGLFVGIFNVIPYFGPLLGGVPAVLAALGTGWQKAMITIAALFLVQQADGLLISPRVMGSITGFSPAVVLLAVFIGAQAGGIIGMLLALPVLLGIRTVYRVFVQQHENN